MEREKYRLDYLRLDERNHLWTTYDPEGREVATLIGEIFPDGMMLHNQVYRWGPVTARELRRLFGEIRGMIRGMGIDKIMPCTNERDPRCLARITAWWRYMGFRYFYTGETDGTKIYLAVMEA